MSRIIDMQERSGGIHTRYEVKPKSHRCRHENFVLDEEAHTVTCKDCGALIDPFAVLVQYASRQRLTLLNTAKYEAANKEYLRLISEWSLTTREQRRINRAMDRVQS